MDEANTATVAGAAEPETEPTASGPTTPPAEATASQAIDSQTEQALSEATESGADTSQGTTTSDGTDLLQWQTKLLPFMTKMLLGLTAFFFLASLVQLFILHQNITRSSDRTDR